MSREAMQQALEALESVRPQNMGPLIHAAKEALRAALAEQEQPSAEPIYQLQSGDGWIDQTEQSYRYNAQHGHAVRVVYEAPPAPVVPQPLTDEELDVMWRSPMSADWEHREYGRLVEAEVLKRMGVQR